MDYLVKANAVLSDERGGRKLKKKDCEAVIPPKKNRLEPSNLINIFSHHLIENFFAKLKAVSLHCHTL
ncbi:hypothetical protein P618_200168 [Holospora obtusa F1]|uniref:Uncharacterized protein n=1 Tax=Holospora obtusa F1 TaxID=1399147 RepID=W6TF72_HOLOB|nr:hypothetical protein P618_200168 [Holospora obtusa F1]